MADKVATPASPAKLVGTPKVQYFVRLLSTKYKPVTREIEDVNDTSDFDKVYDRYQTFFRVYATYEVDGETYKVKSSPLGESAEKRNPNYVG
jgi:hypothetical protein